MLASATACEVAPTPLPVVRASQEEEVADERRLLTGTTEGAARQSHTTEPQAVSSAALGATGRLDDETGLSAVDPSSETAASLGASKKSIAEGDLPPLSTQGRDQENKKKRKDAMKKPAAVSATMWC